MTAPNVVVKNPPYHDRLRLEHLQVGRTLATTADATVAIRNLEVHDLAGASTTQPPAPVAFGDFRPFVFSDHALHFGEQPHLWIVVQVWSIEEQDTDAKSRQLLEHQKLIWVRPCQPVRRQTQD